MIKNNYTNYSIQHAYFFGLKVSIFTYKELINYIEQTLTSYKTEIFYGYSLGIIAYFKKYPEIYTYANKFDLMVADGRLFYLLAKFVGLPLKYEISIPNLVDLILNIADKKKKSVMIVGSTEDNNNLASTNIKKKYRNIKILPGITGGTFEDDEIQIVIKHINFYKPEIILVGVSSPKKERFSCISKDRLTTKIIIPCGGAIDILSGKTKRMPKFIKKIGFGAIWRVSHEPKRLFKRYMLLIYEIIFKLIPIIIIKKRNHNFFLPKIYNIDP